MNKLTYPNIDALIADFKAGAQFEVRAAWYSGNGPVKDIRRTGLYARVTMKDGTYWPRCDAAGEIGYGAQLIKTAEAPSAEHGMSYATAEDMVAAFESGVRFEIQDADAFRNGPVTRMGSAPYEGTVQANGNYYGLDGWHVGWGTPERAKGRIVQVSASPAPKTPETVPFLKSFVTGTPAYNPKTREVVESVAFHKGELLVTLVNEDGVSRVSDRYNHEGKHKHDAARSLVLGELPALPKKPKTSEYVVTGADLFTTAKAGVYEETLHGFHAVVLTNEKARDVLFVTDVGVDSLNRSLWTGHAFKHRPHLHFTGCIS